MCGGCKWQQLPYKQQLLYKQKQVIDALTHIGKIELPAPYPILASGDIYNYRNKLEYTFSNNRWLEKYEIDSGDQIDQRGALGFHLPGMFDKVLDIKHCHLQAEPSNAIRNALKAYTLENEISYYNNRQATGIMRNVIIRTTTTGEVMVVVVFAKDDQNVRESVLTFLKNQFPVINSLMYVVNAKLNDTIHDLPVVLYSGTDHIIEQLEDLKFRIGPKSFFQTNTQQALRMYDVVRSFAAFTGNEIVYDLYTGTGTIANFIARSVKHVAGIEYVSEAIADAVINSEINNITNTEFVAGDMKDVLNDTFIQRNGQPDVIITDPPRAGMHPDVVNKIAQLHAQRIVYVSCNPATQARDLSLLDPFYKVTRIQAVDMFPHTHHVENVVLLERKD